MIQAIFFDMDGLLIDSEQLWDAVGIHVFAQYGVTISLDEYRSTSGMRLDGDVAHWGTKYHIPESDWPMIIEQIVTQVRQEIVHCNLMPGAAQVLSYAKDSGLPISLVSATERVIIEEVLREHGWQDLFTTVIAGDDIPEGKPDPKVYIRAANLAGIPIHAALVFEDSPHGAMSAVHAGARCVAIPKYQAVTHPIMTEVWGKYASLADIDEVLFHSLLTA